MAKLEVFVSHLTVESKFADFLRTHLGRDFIGLMKFFVSSDATSIPVGSQWFDQILAALGKADLQLVICSKESVRRPWINYETGAARILDVEVIPLCHSGIVPEQLPVPLCMSEGVRLTEPEDLKKLYSRISAILECDVPDVDFGSYCQILRALEVDYERQRKTDMMAAQPQSEVPFVENPRVLCVSSPQYRQLGFENQLQMVLDAFPLKLRHDSVFTSDDLRRVCVDPDSNCDIVHIAGYVCPRSGDLYFSEINLPTGGAVGKVDRIRPDALTDLFKEARTKLVVIASGDSLALATSLLTVANVIAPLDIVSTQAMANWVGTFYARLGKDSLQEAFANAGRASGARMRLLFQQRQQTMDGPFAMYDEQQRVVRSTTTG